MERTIRDSTGNVTYSDSGILHLPFDRNGVRPLADYVPVLANPTLLHCQTELPYCGVPFYFPMISFFDGGMIYSPAGSLGEVEPRAQVKLLNRTLTGDGHLRIFMSISGPSHLNIYVALRPGVELVKWSVGTGGLERPYPTAMPAGLERAHYFIYYSYGTAPSTPFVLSVDVHLERGDPRWDVQVGGLVDIALGAHYLTIDDKGTRLTAELTDYMRSMPDWAIPIGWTATYDSWIV